LSALELLNSVGPFLREFLLNVLNETACSLSLLGIAVLALVCQEFGYGHLQVFSNSVAGTVIHDALELELDGAVILKVIFYVNVGEFLWDNLTLASIQGGSIRSLEDNKNSDTSKNSEEDHNDL
jgi:hypothetical protein